MPLHPQQQKEFIAQKGRIVRIIEGSVSRDDIYSSLSSSDNRNHADSKYDVENEASKYREIIQRMKEYNIEVMYVLNKNHGTDDFTLVNLEAGTNQLDIAMKWHTMKNGKIITECTLVNDVSSIREMKRRWANLEDIHLRQIINHKDNVKYDI